MSAAQAITNLKKRNAGVRLGGGANLAQIQAELARRILELTDNGEEVITFFLNTMRSPHLNIKYRLAAAKWYGMATRGDRMVLRKKVMTSSPNIKYRLAAAKWLADRAWGKEPQQVHINSDGIFEALIHASNEELVAIIRGANPTD